MERRTLFVGGLVHRRLFAVLALLAAVALAGCAPPDSATEPAPKQGVPRPALDEKRPASGNREVAIVAGGCFWGVQGVFQHVKGVTDAVAGYAGGSRSDAKYDRVSTGTTGHAESVSVTFDPSVISYGTILRVYFSAAHDPTELNYQGPDDGTQYRSTIFPTSSSQARVARAYIAQLNRSKTFDHRVVTTVEVGRAFYPAEAYHQNYLADHPDQPYIAVNDLPKVEALKNTYPDIYRAKAVLVRRL